MNNKRSHPRLAESYRVAITVKTASDLPELEGKTFYCSTEDISSGGLRFSSPTPVPVGAALELHVVLTWSYWEFTHTGRVAWTREDEEAGTWAVGVEFTDAELPARIAWSDIVENKIVIKDLGKTGHPPKAGPPAPSPATS